MPKSNRQARPTARVGLAPRHGTLHGRAWSRPRRADDHEQLDVPDIPGPRRSLGLLDAQSIGSDASSLPLSDDTAKPPERDVSEHVAPGGGPSVYQRFINGLMGRVGSLPDEMSVDGGPPSPAPEPSSILPSSSPDPPIHQTPGVGGGFQTGSVASEADGSDYITMSSDSDPEASTLPDADAVMAQAAAEVVELLTGPRMYCEDGAHEEQLMQHLASSQSHNSLGVTYIGCRVDRESKNSPIGIDSGCQPRAQGLPREAFPSADDLLACFEGREDLNDHERPDVCLHVEDEASPAIDLAQTFDVDSLLVFPRTLAAFKVPLEWSPMSNRVLNLTANIHVPYKIRQADAPHAELPSQTIDLHEIPHFHIGTISGLPRAVVTIFCPALYGTRKTNFLTDVELEQFNDKLWSEATTRRMPTGMIQYITPNRAVAALDADARRKEQSVTDLGRRQYGTYSIQPRLLGGIWDEIQHKIRGDEATYWAFRGMFLFVNVKGVKLSTQRDSISEATAAFDRHMGELFDVSLLDRYMLDLAHETTPRAPADSYGRQPAVVLLPKTCCAQALYSRMSRKVFGGRRGRATYYNYGFLRDASSMTVTPPQRDAVKTGWYYTQVYATSKTILDAWSTYPFSHPQHLDLAVDEAIYRQAASRAHSKAAHDWDAVGDAFLQSRNRCSSALKASSRKSFGVRYEVRIDDQLYELVKRLLLRRTEETRRDSSPWRLRTDEVESSSDDSLVFVASAGSSLPGSSHAGETSDGKDGFWRITTRRYCDFVLGNLNKFAKAFDIATVTAPLTGVSLYRSRLRAIMLLCLRSFWSANIGAEPALYYAERVRDDGVVRRGLGFEETMRRYGYAWFGPLIDWSNLAIQVPGGTVIASLENKLLTWYGDAPLLQDVQTQLQGIFDSLPQCGDGSSPRDEFVIQLLCHFAFREYRRDVIKAFVQRGQVRHGFKDSRRQDDIQFTEKGVSLAFTIRHNLIQGNKTMATRPEYLMEWLWGSGSSTRYPRKFFETASFRIIYANISATLESHASTHFRQAWQDRFMVEFFRFHPLVPYPDTNGVLISTNKVNKSKNDMYATGDSQGARNYWPALVIGNEVVWAKKRYQDPPPFTYPEELDLDADAIQARIRRYPSSNWRPT